MMNIFKYLTTESWFIEAFNNYNAKGNVLSIELAMKVKALTSENMLSQMTKQVIKNSYVDIQHIEDFRNAYDM